MSFSLSPGNPNVLLQETDLSVQPQGLSPSVGAIVFGSRKGPLTRQYITNTQTFKNKYGGEDPDWTLAHIQANAFLEQANQLYALRVVNGAKYSTATFYGQADGSWLGASGDSTKGQLVDYTNTKAAYTIKVVGSFVASNQLTMTITDGVSTQTVSVTYATSHANTMSLLRAAVLSAVSALTAGSGASVTLTGDYIRILAPINVTYIFGTPTISGGVSSPTVTVTNDRAITIYAENPGAWANDIGVKITGVDSGVRQTVRLSFSGPLITGNTYNLNFKVNNQTVTITQVTYANSSDYTMGLIATAIQTALQSAFGSGNGTASVVTVAGAFNNDLEIDIVSPLPGPSTIDLTSFVSTVASGDTQATTSVAETIAGIARTGKFQISVYSRSNPNVAIETIDVQMTVGSDNLGLPLYIADRINTGSLASTNIRVAVDPSYNGGAPLSNSSSILWLNGGTDGSLPTSSQIAAGWESFRYREDVNARILINGAYANATVHKKMAQIAEARRDAFATLDMPSAYQGNSQACVDYVRQVLNIQTSYAGIFAPDLQVQLQDGRLQYVGPAGHVAARFAYTDQQRGNWYSPAGLNRGVINTIQGLRINFTAGDQPLLYENRVNYILNKPGQGYVLWTAETLIPVVDMLENINVRRFLSDLEVTLVDALAYHLQEPNDDITRSLITQMIENYVAPYINARAIRSYSVVSTEAQTPKSMEDRGFRGVDLRIVPTVPTKVIGLNVVIANQSLVFNETNIA